MNDPVMLAFSTLFDNITESIDTNAEQKLYAIEVQQRLNKNRGNMQTTDGGFGTMKSNISINPTTL